MKEYLHVKWGTKYKLYRQDFVNQSVFVLRVLESLITSSSKTPNMKSDIWTVTKCNSKRRQSTANDSKEQFASTKRKEKVDTAAFSSPIYCYKFIKARYKEVHPFTRISIAKMRAGVPGGVKTFVSLFREYKRRKKTDYFYKIGIKFETSTEILFKSTCILKHLLVHFSIYMSSIMMNENGRYRHMTTSMRSLLVHSQIRLSRSWAKHYRCRRSLESLLQFWGGVVCWNGIGSYLKPKKWHSGWFYIQMTLIDEINDSKIINKSLYRAMNFDLLLSKQPEWDLV